MADTPASRARPPYGIPPPAYRLPDATRVGAVHLQVVDLDRSLAFYTDVLGLVERPGHRAPALLTAHDDERPLLALHTRPGVTRARRGTFGLFHFAMLLPERRALGRFAAHLARRHVQVGMADHLVSEALYLSDPDGLGIEVYADRPRATWAHHDGELAMTTDPLDVSALMAAGGDAAWDGAPAGTTIGHVHLHVGTLADAERFYHRAIGLDQMVWSYPGALFLAAGGYHHHLGTNVWSPGPAPTPDAAQLLAWELVVPSDEDVAAVGRSVEAAGYAVEAYGADLTIADPWGTRVRVRADGRDRPARPAGGSRDRR